MTVRVVVATIAIGAITISGCSSDSVDEAVSTPSQATASTSTVAPAAASSSTVAPAGDFPDIIAAQATRQDAGTWRFDVTVSSPYDSPERYADAWRVLGPDGSEFGIRVLTHDHASEQPFTRSQGGIEIPAGVTTVTIQGRDLANGWGGGTLDLVLP